MSSPGTYTPPSPSTTRPNASIRARRSPSRTVGAGRNTTALAPPLAMPATALLSVITRANRRASVMAAASSG